MRQDSEADISAEALQAPREWHDILTVLKVKKKKKKLKQKPLLSRELFSKKKNKLKTKTTSQQGIIHNEEEIKIFSDKQKLRFHHH